MREDHEQRLQQQARQLIDATPALRAALERILQRAAQQAGGPEVAAPPAAELQEVLDHCLVKQALRRLAAARA